MLPAARLGCCVLAFALLGCGPADVDEDMDAIGACNRAVKARVPGQELRSTVRDDGPQAWIVNVWADEPAEGTPDFRCTVVRDDRADEGLRVDSIRP